MKRILYFTAYDMSSASSGINKKIKEQIATLRRLGFQVDAYYRRNDEQLFCESEDGERLIADKMRRPYKIAASKYLKKYVEDNKKRYDGAYIRYVYGDQGFDALLRCLKKNQTTILVEIPTFPYDTELKNNLENRIVLFLDRVYRNKMKNYVDRVVTYSKDETIFGIPTIQTMNGVNFEKIRMISPDKTYAGKINIIAVANLMNWHGYDRLLEGMGLYYRDNGARDILFHLVGDGKELEKYRKIVDKYGIQEHVIFYGRKDGEELDKIYDYCQLSAACFGFHRIGIKLSSNLKSREYLAKGLPILSSVDIDVFQGKDIPYFLKVSYDDTPIDMEEVISFYDKIFFGRSKLEIAKEIRNFARPLCDINIAMRPISNYFNI